MRHIILTTILLLLSSCVGFGNDSSAAGMLKKIDSLKSLQGTYIDRSIAGSNRGLSSILFNEPVTSYFVRITYVDEHQLYVEALDRNREAVKARRYFAGKGKDFVFEDGKVTLENPAKTSHSAKRLLLVLEDKNESLMLNDKENIAYRDEERSAGVAYGVPHVTQSAYHAQFQRVE